MSALTRSQPVLQLARASLLLGSGLRALLGIYAACFFSSSVVVGGLVLGATLLEPRAGLLGMLGALGGVASARVLGLVRKHEPATGFAYSALFMGLGAGHTFADPVAALALTALGAAATVLLTVSMQSVLARFALPPLSVPFLIVYMCALSMGRALGAHWALPTAAALPELALLPMHVRAFFEALGAFLFTVRADAGMLVFAAFCFSSPRAALCAVLGYTLCVGGAHALHVAPGLSFAAALNATVSAVFLGMSSPRAGWQAYVRASAGALLCLLFTLGLAGPLGRLELSPLSLPFNLSIYTALLIERQRQQPLARYMTPRKAQG